MRDGIQVAVIGAPNAGKSSLVNALVQRDVAITSETAGTTRDVIEAHLDIGGYPVILADTAGLRPDQIGSQGQDAIEGEGIKRALQRAEDADITLLIFDGTAEIPDPHTLNLIDGRAILVTNKMDMDGARSQIDASIMISADKGDGIQILLDTVLEKIKQFIGSRETPSLTRHRHRAHLQDALDCLRQSHEATLPELMAEDVRLAMRSLGKITGKVNVEDLLDVIFNDFCIGK